MDNPLVLYKRLGETPLACLERYRADHTELTGVPMTYAGRLDPLAEGTLIVLVGEAVHEKENYLHLDKEYVMEVLFGFSTDTHDVLGIVGKAGAGEVPEPAPARTLQISPQQIKSILDSFLGTRTQKYPLFSSKTFLGKPLFAWARGEGIADADIPSRETTIHEITLLDLKTLTRSELEKSIYEKIALVIGDFRQDSILAKWQETLATAVETYTVATIRVSCSSGSYMRTLAHEIGQKLGIPSLAFHILRTKVGLFRATK